MTGLVLTGSLTTYNRPAFAAKPAPIPAGTIYYFANKPTPDYLGGMKGDGSGKFEALPTQAFLDLNRNPIGESRTPGAYPSNQPSGDRWWITPAITGTYDSYTYPGGSTRTDWPHSDMVAVRRSHADPTQLDVVQLTDFFGRVSILYGDFSKSQWSNDSNDGPSSFVGVEVYDIRGAYDPGTNSASVVGIPPEMLRLPITVSEIEAIHAGIASGLLAPDFVPFDDTLTDAELDALLWPSIQGIPIPQGSTSPAGDLSVAVVSGRLMIVDAAAPDYSNPVRLLWDGNVAAPQMMYVPQWSPDGQTIAFYDGSASETVQAGQGFGDIWTVRADGSAPPKKVLDGSQKGRTNIYYHGPFWSPDSKFLVCTRAFAPSGAVSFETSGLIRVPAAGGTLLDLGVVTPLGWSRRWVSGN